MNWKIFPKKVKRSKRNKGNVHDNKKARGFNKPRVRRLKNTTRE